MTVFLYLLIGIRDHASVPVKQRHLTVVGCNDPFQHIALFLVVCSLALGIAEEALAADDHNTEGVHHIRAGILEIRRIRRKNLIRTLVGGTHEPDQTIHLLHVLGAIGRFDLIGLSVFEDVDPVLHLCKVIDVRAEILFFDLFPLGCRNHTGIDLSVVNRQCRGAR